MSTRNGTENGRIGEESPLLGQDRSLERSDTLASSRDGVLNDGKANQHVGRGRGWLIALSLFCLIFLQAANMSGVTTTQSVIAEDLDAFAEASWFTSAYLIAMSSLSPVAARLSQIFSPRNGIFIGAILFSIGGIVTSQASTLAIFLIGRAISGSGGATIFVLSFVLALELAEKKRRGLFIGAVNTALTIGVSVGAVVAGAVAPTMGWRFLFWIQTPISLTAGATLFFSIPKTFSSGAKASNERSIKSKLANIDYLGAVTLTGSLVTFLFGLSFSKVLWTPIIGSIILLVVFIVTELYIAGDPIIPVTVLKSRGTLLACLAQLGMMSARWMVLFYSPVYAIAIRGWEPAAAGAMLIPTNAGFATGGLLIGWLHVKRAGSFWLASIVAMFFFSCSLLLISQLISPTTPAPLFIVAVFVNGFTTGATLNYALAHVMHLTPPSTHFISTSLLNTFRGFAGSFGSAIGGGLFIRVLKSGLENGFRETGGLEGREDLVRRLLGSPALVQKLGYAERRVAVESYSKGLATVFFAGSVVALCMVFIQAGTGWKGGKEVSIEEREVGNGIGQGNEEWEEGMEQGV